MKRFFQISAAALLMLAAAGCSDKRDPSYSGVALVTFRQQADNSYFIRQSETTVLRPLNSGWDKWPFKDNGEKRGLITFVTDMKESNVKPTGAEKFQTVYDVTLTSVDTISIKKPVPAVEDMDEVYGNDYVVLNVEPTNLMCTQIDDGYLNVFGSIMATDRNARHEFNLVSGIDPQDPYAFELRHNAYGDNPKGAIKYDFLMNFSLKDLPDTEGKKVKLRIYWNDSNTMQKEYWEFDYVSRTDW